jgi:hypothetical protein
MFGRGIHWSREHRALSRDTGDVHNTFRVAGAGFACLGLRRWVEPTRYGNLGRADRMGEVNIKQGIVAYSVSAARIIFRFCSSRWVPEVGPVRFKDAGTRAYLLLLAGDTGALVDVMVDKRCQRLQIPSQ